MNSNLKSHLSSLISIIVLLLMVGGCENEEKVKDYLIGKWIFIDEESNYYELWLNDENLSIGYIGEFDVLDLYEYKIEGKSIHFYKIFEDTTHLSFSFELDQETKNKFIAKSINKRDTYIRHSKSNPKIFSSYEENLSHLDSLRIRTTMYYKSTTE